MRFLCAARWPRGYLTGASGLADSLGLSAALGRRSGEWAADRQESELTSAEELASRAAVAELLAEARRDETFSFALAWRLEGQTRVHLDYSQDMSADLAKTIVDRATDCPCCGRCGALEIERFNWTATQAAKV
jgi:hypothetical protein